LGAAAGAGLIIGAEGHWAAIAGGCLLPAAGATAGYNVSRAASIRSSGWASKRIGLPSLAISPVRAADGSVATELDLRILTARF
jgi:hypothetical protein